MINDKHNVNTPKGGKHTHGNSLSPTCSFCYNCTITLVLLHLFLTYISKKRKKKPKPIMGFSIIGLGLKSYKIAMYVMKSCKLWGGQITSHCFP
jgi:hypothetical protein